MNWLKRVMSAAKQEPAEPKTFDPELPAHRFRSAVMATLNGARRKQVPSLEAHLRALWTQVGLHRDYRPCFGLFAELIRRALEGTPAEFQYEWLKVEAPHWHLDDDGYLIQVHDDATGLTTLRRAEDLEVLRQVLTAQIADLNRIPGTAAPDPNSGFAIVSPSGQRWYNVDLVSYWECATAGLEAKIANPSHRQRFLRQD